MFWFYWVIAFVSPGELSAPLPPSTYPPTHPPTHCNALCTSVTYCNAFKYNSPPTHCNALCTLVTHCNAFNCTPTHPLYNFPLNHCKALYFTQQNVFDCTYPLPHPLYCTSPTTHCITPCTLPTAMHCIRVFHTHFTAL